jgi:hypothetical protein
VQRGSARLVGMVIHQGAFPCRPLRREALAQA